MRTRSVAFGCFNPSSSQSETRSSEPKAAAADIAKRSLNFKLALLQQRMRSWTVLNLFPLGLVSDNMPSAASPVRSSQQAVRESTGPALPRGHAYAYPTFPWKATPGTDTSPPRTSEGLRCLQAGRHDDCSRRYTPASGSPPPYPTSLESGPTPRHGTVAHPPPGESWRPTNPRGPRSRVAADGRWEKARHGHRADRRANGRQTTNARGGAALRLRVATEAAWRWRWQGQEWGSREQASGWGKFHEAVRQDKQGRFGGVECEFVGKCKAGGRLVGLWTFLESGTKRRGGGWIGMWNSLGHPRWKCVSGTSAEAINSMT